MSRSVLDHPLSSNSKVAPLSKGRYRSAVAGENHHSPDSGLEYSLDHNLDYSLGGEQEHSWDHKLEHRPARKGTL